MERPTLYFGGGLGDVILRVYRKSGYMDLKNISVPYNILLYANNPFVVELFRWHPNRSQFVIFDLFHKFLEFKDNQIPLHERDQKIFSFVGIPWESRTGNEPASSKPEFYAPDTIDSSGHIVFQPFAGGKERCVPDGINRRLLEIFAKTGRKVYVVMRSYVRKENGRSIHSQETFPYDLPDNCEVLTDLTVPATLQLVAGCHAFIGAFSSLLMAAWFEKRRTVVFYPKGFTDWDTPGKGYSWGANFDNCYHTDFDSVDFGIIFDALT